MRSPMCRPSFLAIALIGAAAMWILAMWQLGWLPYLAYVSAWGDVEWLSLDVVVASLVSLLAGWNLAAMIVIVRHHAAHRAAGAGFFAALGAMIGSLAFACVGCHAVVITLFGIAIGMNALEPWLPAMRIASLILLIIATVLMRRKLRDPHICRR